MKVTWKWLAEFVDMDVPLSKLADRLVMTGLEIESVEERGRELVDVICAEIVQVRPHPHAERLSVCDVRTRGDAIATVVCGAPNVHAGARVAFAPAGTTLPGDHHIAATDIRGVASAGMLCSEAELDLGPDAGGLLILPSEAPIGERVAAVLGVEDTVLDIAVTPNRGDCLSVLGIAREIAALTGQRLRRHRVSVREAEEATADLIAVRVVDSDLCGRYVGRVVTNLKIQPSPRWMQSRLRAVGMRPINNVVDVTNYVMIERGQPLHAFDYDRLPHKEIVVRRAGADATFTTLDAQGRALQPDDLMITSGDEPVAIAGIMGGADTEVAVSTRRILLESAWFAPSAVRRTAKRLGLRTEASYRFERSTDIEGAAVAADRAAGLIARLGAGSVTRGRVDAYPAPRLPVPITLRLKRVDALLGMAVGRAEILWRLKALGLSVSPGTRGALMVTSPSYRSDLLREIDLIEEIVRLGGYENVPATLPECALSGTGEELQQRRQRQLKRWLVAQGLTETILLSFCSARQNGLFPGLGEPRSPVSIVNPLSQEDGELRQSLCAGLIRVVRDNLAQGAEHVAIFSMGKVFWRGEGFDEGRRLAGAVCRALPSVGVGARGTQVEFVDLKGIVEMLLESLAVRDVRWVPATDLSAFHPGKTARVERAGVVLGVVGALHPAVEEELRVDGPCWLFELDLDQLLQYCPRRIVYQDLPRFPGVVRDLAVVTEESFAADEVIHFVHAWGAESQLIEDVHLFDQYIGPSIPAGKKSLAYTISYRSPDRTLTDAEVNDMHMRLIAALRDTLHIEPR